MKSLVLFGIDIQKVTGGGKRYQGIMTPVVYCSSDPHYSSGFVIMGDRKTANAKLFMNG